MSRLHVPRRWLLILAGCVWMGAGVMLCVRAAHGLSDHPTDRAWLEEIGGIALAFFLYSFALARIAQKNIDRIHTLPERAHVHRFIPLKSYVMIVGMIALGIALRQSSLPPEWLILPYTAMGGALILGGIRYLRSLSGLD